MLFIYLRSFRFEIGSQITKDGLELLILLPPPPNFWDYRVLHYAQFMQCGGSGSGPPTWDTSTLSAELILQSQEEVVPSG